jgi:hypothetical protein
MDRLYARQAHLLPIAIAAAEHLAREGEHIWVGIPPTRYGPPPDLLEAVGNEKTAQGAAVWIGGASRQGLRLFAVLSPVAGRIDSGLADSWRRRGVNIYIAEEREADRVKQALGSWPATQLRLHRSDHELLQVELGLRERLAARQRKAMFRQSISEFMGGGYTRFR